MSCLFQSIGTLIHKAHHDTRKEICDYMQSHLEHEHQGMRLKDWIHWQLHSPNPHQYIRKMRQPSEWGGAMELAIATKVYKADIRVIDGYGIPVAEFWFKDQSTARRRLILRWTGNHYEGVNQTVL